MRFNDKSQVVYLLLGHPVLSGLLKRVTVSASVLKR